MGSGGHGGKNRNPNRPRAVCTQCGKNRDVNNFYYHKRNGGVADRCKECMCSTIDNRDPSTFVPALKELDFPYIPRLWVEVANEAYMKNPSAFGCKSVLGKYISKFAMFQYRGFGFDDAEAAEIRRYGTPEERKHYKEQMRAKLDRGNITENQYRTMTGDVSMEDVPFDVVDSHDHPIITYDAASVRTDDPKTAAPSEPAPVPAPAPVPIPDPGVPNAGEPEPQEDDPLSEMIPDFAAETEQKVIDELTPDDMRTLGIKWGMSYKPSEWVKMESMYNQYCYEYEMSVDREQVLRNICKCSLKMDEALDVGDVKTYKDLSTTFDMLRKSGRFTEAQKKEEQKRDLDSIGELVAYVESNSGAIPRMDDPIEHPKDKVDFVIQDLKHYVDKLVKEDLGLSDLIESYIKKADSKGVGTVEDIMRQGFDEPEEEVVEEDSRSFQDFLQEEIEKEAARLAGGDL